MTHISMGRFKKGLFLGGVFGAGMMWLMGTKRGREVRAQLLNAAAELYGDLRDQILGSSQFKQLTKQKYVKMVTEAVDKYAIQNDLAANTKKMLVRLLSTQWTNLKQEIAKKAKK